jgi:hypothetical protein
MQFEDEGLLYQIIDRSIEHVPANVFFVDILWQTNKFWQLLKFKISRFTIHSQAGIGSKGWKMLSAEQGGYQNPEW